MNRVLLVLVALVALGGAAWLLLGSSPDDGGERERGREAASARVPPDESARPGLATTEGGGRGARDGAAARGASSIVGTVTRGGAPVAARVEIRFAYEADMRPSSKSGGFAAMISRMLVPPAALAGPMTTVQAGADGRFEATGLGVGVFEARAVAADGASGAALATVPVDGARVEANPAISAGTETLRGRVVKADGTAWAGVVVVEAGRASSPFWQPSPSASTIEVGADGRFAATGLEPGTVTVSAYDRSGTFRVMSKPVAIPRADEYVMTVDASLVPVTGRVVADDDGSPIAGATVLAGGEAGDLMLVAKTATAADGTFALAAGGAGKAALLVSAPGFAGVMRQATDAKGPVEIRLARGANVVGRVLADPGGAPVLGVTVTVVTSAQRDAGLPIAPATSDAAGRYEVVDLAAGEAMVTAEGAGWVTKGAKDLTSDGYNPYAATLVAGKTATVDVTVVRGGTAKGVVEDGGGAPVVGAVVGATRGASVGMPSFSFDGRRGPLAASGPDGTFALDGLVVGAGYTFTASAPGRADATAGPLTATDGVLEVRLRFPTARWIDVTVVDDATGAGVVGARVMAYLDTSGMRRMGPPVPSGVGGAARVGPFGPGPVRLTVDANDHLRSSDVRVADGETAVTVRLQRGLAIAGRVLRPDRTPAVGARVSAREGNGMSSETVTADATGAFRVTRLAAGEHVLNARLDEATPLAAEVKAKAGGDDVTLVLAPRASAEGGKLIVKVVGPDGTPVPRAQVRLHHGSGYSGSSLRDGRLELSMSSRGSDLSLEVYGAKSADGSFLPYGPGRLPSVPPEGGEVTVRLPAEMRVEGVVRGPDGQGVKGIVVTAEAVGRDRGATEAGTTSRTDASGAFSIGGLGDDDHRLTVKPPPEFAPPAPVSVRGGASGVVIVLKGGVRARISVVDWRGGAVAGSNVSAVAAGDTPGVSRPWSSGSSANPSATTDAEGVAVLPALDPEIDYRLTTHVPPGREDLKAVTTEAWRPADTTVRLTRSYRVRGRVVDLAGRPIAGANVHRETAPNSWAGAATAEDGTFVFLGLDAGEVKLRALMPGIWTGSGETTTVAAGTEDVVLTLDPGAELLVRVEGRPPGAAPHAALRAEGEPFVHLDAPLSAEGVARFRGLVAGRTYTVWYGPLPDGLVAFERGLSPGPAEHRLRLAAGKTLRGRASAPPGGRVHGVQARMKDGPMNVQGVVNSDGTYEVKGLPDGTWTLRAYGRVGDASIEASGEAAAGGTLDLDLRAK